MSKYDPAIPRRKYMSTALKSPRRCPECGGRLEADAQTYYIAVKGRTFEPEPYIVGSDGGYFCPRCPVIVLDAESFSHMARLAIEKAHPGASDMQFVVLGLVDVKQVPPEKSHLPFGDDNPLPTVACLPLDSQNRRI